MKQRLRRIGLDVDGVLGGEDRRQPLVGRRPVVDQQDAAAAARCRRPRCAPGACMPISREVMARMRSSSVIIFSRVSERTRAISATSDTGLVRKSSAPASSPRTRSDGLIERGDHDHRDVMRRRIGLEPAADLEAVHVRHHHVEQDDVAFGALADRQRLGAVAWRSARRNIRPTAALPAA